MSLLRSQCSRDVSKKNGLLKITISGNDASNKKQSEEKHGKRRRTPEIGYVRRSLPQPRLSNHSTRNRHPSSSQRSLGHQPLSSNHSPRLKASSSKHSPRRGHHSNHSSRQEASLLHLHPTRQHPASPPSSHRSSRRDDHATLLSKGCASKRRHSGDRKRKRKSSTSHRRLYPTPTPPLEILKTAGQFSLNSLLHSKKKIGGPDIEVVDEDDGFDQELFRTSSSKSSRSVPTNQYTGNGHHSSSSSFFASDARARLATEWDVAQIRIPDRQTIARQRWCKFCALSLKTVGDLDRHLLSQKHQIVTGEYFLDRLHLLGRPRSKDRVQCVVCGVALIRGESTSEHLVSLIHQQQLRRWETLDKPYPPIKFYIDSQ